MTQNDFVLKHYHRNFLMNVLDGAFFSFGTAFYSSGIILPLYVKHLTDSPFIISLVPAIASAGWFLPQLLTARQFEARARRLPFVMALTAHERIPVVLLGLSILLWPNLSPAVALPLFFLLQIWQTVGGGLTAPGWVDLVARVMPLERRGRLLGVTNMVGNAMGAAGAGLSAYLLAIAAYPRGFAYVFLAASVALMVSWVFLGLIVEPAVEVAPTAEPTADYWRRLPDVLRRHPNLMRYLLARVPAILSGAANGFFVVFAVERFGLPDEVAGGFTAALLIAIAISNPAVGALGDRLGHKVVMELSLAVQALSLVVALLASAPGWFYVAFALQGISAGAGMVGSLGILMEFGDESERPTIVGLSNTLQGFIFMVGPLLGGLAASFHGYRAAFWLALAASAVALVAMRFAVVEPRHTNAPIPE
jgi:MFS family permease